MSNVGEAVESTRHCSRLCLLAAIVPQLGHLGKVESLSSDRPRPLLDEWHRRYEGYESKVDSERTWDFWHIINNTTCCCL